MTPELYWLTLTAIFTAVLWVPYILKTIMEIGVIAAFTDGSGNPLPQAPWAARLKKAHANAVENLVVFAVVIFAVILSGTASALTAQLAMVFFVTRAVHAVIYTLGLPLLRSVAFIAGAVCQVWLGFIALGMV